MAIQAKNLQQQTFLHSIETHAKGSLFLAAALALIASVLSMAAIYGDPLAHIKICLGGSADGLASSNAILLYGHCGWCYLALGLAVAALVVPGKPKQS